MHNMKDLLRRSLLGVLLGSLTACGPSISNYTTTNTSGSMGMSGSTSNTLTGLGSTWTTQNSGTTTGFRSICFGAGRWLAVGTGGGVGVTAESTDGVTWNLTQQTATQYYDLTAAGCGNSIFVATSSNGILASGDGVSWAQASISTPDPNTYPQQIAAVTYGNGIWVAVDNLFFTNNGWGILTSADGASWTEAIVTGPYAQPTAITYGNGLYVVVGYGGLVLTSPDATTWTNETLSAGYAIMSIVFANGQFVAVTNSGQALISTDAVNWTSYSDSASYPNGIAYGGGAYLILGSLSGGTVAVSSDGKSWTNATSYLPSTLTNSGLTSAAYGNSTFVAVGGSGEIGTTQ